MVEKMLSLIDKSFSLTERDEGEYRTMKVSGMHFTIRSFHAEGLGHVSAMTAAGFFGLMKMDTLIITPTEIDMPLFSYDRVLAMGNDTLIFELYDTMTGRIDLSTLANAKNRAVALPAHDPGEHWYDSIKLPVSYSKKGKKKLHFDNFNAAAEDYLLAFLNAAGTAPDCDAAAKREKASLYVEGLLSHGGPSTDVFKRGIGDEKTADLFRRVLFGTQI